jgi:hypothetical protein
VQPEEQVLVLLEVLVPGQEQVQVVVREEEQGGPAQASGRS